MHKTNKFHNIISGKFQDLTISQSNGVTIQLNMLNYFCPFFCHFYAHNFELLHENQIMTTKV